MTDARKLTPPNLAGEDTFLEKCARPIFHDKQISRVLYFKAPPPRIVCVYCVSLFLQWWCDGLYAYFFSFVSKILLFFYV